MAHWRTARTPCTCSRTIPHMLYLRATLWELAGNYSAAIDDLEAYLKAAPAVPLTQKAELEAKIQTLREQISLAVRQIILRSRNPWISAAL